MKIIKFLLIYILFGNFFVLLLRECLGREISLLLDVEGRDLLVYVLMFLDRAMTPFKHPPLTQRLVLISN